MLLVHVKNTNTLFYEGALPAGLPSPAPSCSPGQEGPQGAGLAAAGMEQAECSSVLPALPLPAPGKRRGKAGAVRDGEEGWEGRRGVGTSAGMRVE